MGGIVMIGFTLWLWLIVRWGWIDRWSPLAGTVIGWSLLGMALFFQFFWLALVIEGWWYGGPPHTENSWLQPLVDAISFAIGAGRKTALLSVGITGLICLARTWRLAAPGEWLTRVAAWVSTFALVGVLLHTFALLLWSATSLWQEQTGKLIQMNLQQIFACLLCLGLFFVTLARVQPKRRLH